MAGQRLTDKTAFTEQLAVDDMLMIVDKSDTTGSAAGTSKKMNAAYLSTTVKVTGTLDLATNPLTLIAAPAAGYYIQVIACNFLWTYGSAATTVSSNVYVGFDSGSTGNYLIYQRNMYKDETADRSYLLGSSTGTATDGTVSGSPAAKALICYATADLGGDSTYNVYITYQLIKI